MIGGVGGAVVGNNSSMGSTTGILGGVAAGAIVGGIVGMVQDAREKKEQDRLAQERGVRVWDVATGKVAREMTSPEPSHESATWSPDGAAITFANDRGGGGDIYRMDIDAGTVVPLSVKTLVFYN